MNLESPIALSIGLLLTAATTVVYAARWPSLPRASGTLFVLGLIALSAAAAGVSIHRPQSGRIVVMVDLSPSTRTAAYRDRQLLQRRLDELLDGAPHRVEEFGDGADRTVFSPPQADAIVLFSDCRFDLPATTPPTYVVIDPGLHQADDAAVARLESHGPQIVATVRNAGQARELSWSGLRDRHTQTIDTGKHVLTGRIDPGDLRVGVRLASGDAWPENDSLSLVLPPQQQFQRWWVGDGPPEDAWRTMRPGELPDDPIAYMATSVIVLNNIAAEQISAAIQDRLMQYVRDLGGGLVILGGDRAFAAGAYQGSVIEVLSPLASSAPLPTRQWIVLLDSSGSMAGMADGTSRWDLAKQAVAQLLPTLPPNDLLSIGSFARDLRWWQQMRPVGQTQMHALAPHDIAPHGPTNLQPVLEAIASQLDGSVASEIILLSDADASIDQPQALATALSAKKARLHLLATADVSRSAVPAIVSGTGGQMLSRDDPRLWPKALRQLARSATTTGPESSMVAARFMGELASISARSLERWNRTWLKPDATLLAEAQTSGGPVPLAARWQFGAGRAAAAAFDPVPHEAQSLAELVAQPPRDPRLRLNWSAGPDLLVTVDAIEQDRFLNDLDLSLQLIDQSGSHRLEQVAPGRYELRLPAPRRPVLAMVRLDDRIVDRFAVAERYAPEFDAIGNDIDVMRELARRSGGAVIEPSQHAPIDFNWPRRQVSLVSLLAAIGACAIAIGLIVWRRG